MKFEQYVSLIRRLEDYASSNPSSYQYRVYGLAMLGYLYFIGLIALFTLPIGIVVTGLIFAPGETFRSLLMAAKLWWIIIPGIGVFFGFLGGAIRSIFAKVPEPEGLAIERSAAPELFDFVSDTSKALATQRPKRVQITDEFNASVVTLPRFGIFGRKVYLRLGLPLMRALSPEQFKAVIAHELGHVSGRHGAFGKWAFQVQEAWDRFIQSQEAAENRFASLYERFVKWYFPYFSAYSFVLMRENEKDADRDAVKLAGSKPLGEALIALHTRDTELQENFWKAVHQENLENPDPSPRLFSRMLGAMTFVDHERERLTLEKAVSVPTDYGDTHPSLGDRLRLIGYWNGSDLPHLPAVPSQSAAEVFLGSSADAFAATFDESWDEKAAKDWKTRYDHFQESQKRLDELDTKAQSEDLTDEEMVEIALRIAEKQGPEIALPTLESAAEKYHESALVKYNLAGVRLALGDERGIADAELAIELDESYRLAGSELIFEYLRGKGRIDEAKKYANTAEKQYEKLGLAQKERDTVQPGDNFEPHSLPQDLIDLIPVKLGTFEEITAIYLVKKVVKYYPEIPMHVMFIDVRPTKTFNRSGDLSPSEILKIVTDRFGDTEINFFAILVTQFAALKPHLEKIEGAKVFSRGH